MVDFHRTVLDAGTVKYKALELGADLVGIADGAAMNAHPPYPDDPRRPSDISEHDAGRVIVLARRLSAGTSRIAGWDERHKFYNDELVITALEEIALELVLWLEDHGYPALIVPPTHVDPWRYQGDPGEHLSPLLSLEHAAVEAGLGTLGLNLQLLTPEYGPRVILTAVLCSVDVTPDQPRSEGLCLGPQCGRCVQACPGDVIGHFARDWPACDRYRAPYGFQKLNEFFGEVLDAPDVEAKRSMLRSESSFYLWQSILRGAGAVTGCRRCQEVCPVGDDYPALLADVMEQVPEATPEKSMRLGSMCEEHQRDELPPGYFAQRRWIGALPAEPSAGSDQAERSADAGEPGT